MEDLILSKNEFTPSVNFDISSRVLIIEGRCIPEDAHSFFTPIINWISSVFENNRFDKHDEFQLKIFCDYYNSASAKMLVYLFDKVAEIQKGGYNLLVSWHCNIDDPELIDSVNDYTTITDAIIEVKHI